jgi:tRNA-2-methylthio-N6-dimethylallyladenosine synthase
MPFLHLPVQSGSDRMLAAMNRRHTAEEYLRLVDRLRAARPDMALSSDFIVGHPGETEADFQDTMTLIRTVGFTGAFSFKYSPRPGTAAAGAANQIDEPTKDRRLQELQALLRDQQAAFNESKVGQVVDVLFTHPGRRDGQIGGRTPWLQPVHVPGPESLIGRIVPVRIAHAQPASLTGTLELEIAVA